MQRITREQARKYAFDWRDEPLLRVKPGEPFEIEWELHPKDYVFPEGHRIGLVITSNLTDYVTLDPMARNVSIKLDGSHLVLPVASGLAEGIAAHRLRGGYQRGAAATAGPVRRMQRGSPPRSAPRARRSSGGTLLSTSPP